MKSKIFNLSGISVLLLILSMSFVFAVITVSVPTSPTTMTKSTNSTTFTVNSSISANFSYPTTATITDADGNTATFALTNTTSILNTQTATFNVTTSTISSSFNLEKDTKAITITAANASNSTDTNTTSVTLTFDNQNYCSSGDQGGNLTFGKVNIDNAKGFGEDDDEWYPLDEIEVSIRVDNDGNEDIDDIVVEWGVYSTKEDKWVIDEEENEFNLKDGKKETLNVEFNVDPDDLSTDMGDDYVLYVKAYSDDLGEGIECVSNSDDITITIDNDFVVLDDFEISDVVSCGSEVPITADVWNIGEDDQEDVYLLMYNKELGINEEIIIGDVDSLENEKLSTNINIPSDMEEKFYTLKFWVYDEDNEVYENDNNDDSEFSLPFKVEGSCGADSTTATTSSKVLVSANLESGGKAGDELVVKSVVRNTGDKLTTYEVVATGYTDWASSVSQDLSTVILGVGESKEVLFTFDVNKDSVGDQLFNVEITSGDKLLVKQPVSVSIEESGFNLISSIKNNKYLWGIGLINLILIVAIIAVVMRVRSNSINSNI
ncbi:hypothetical protein CMI40_00915 [Candidatus Pacearchaeota archaeon]|jgi:hypothetical protein|nr:hypothetical protein [Candidatus Pacearchaeota archaeon]|tara:strand:+ start:3174 stop:4814 length:1641 start_codon:yes stop_codon:yes gene_type:complete